MSRKRAIDDKCRECIYDPHSKKGTWRQQVAMCTATNCPLFPYRPLPSTKDTQEINESAANEPLSEDG